MIFLKGFVTLCAVFFFIFLSEVMDVVNLGIGLLEDSPMYTDWVVGTGFEEFFGFIFDAIPFVIPAAVVALVLWIWFKKPNPEATIQT